MEIKLLGPHDIQLLSSIAPGTFDDPIDVDATEEFLSDGRHHIAIAVENESVIGFASAVHYVHPDKQGPEMWINEVSVAEPYRGKGTAKALLNALLQRARELQCSEAWVLTERDNVPAMKLYKALGGVEGSQDTVMFMFPS